MSITIHARHLSITDEMREYAERKAEGLTKYFDRIHGIEVILDVEGKRGFSAEMIVGAPRGIQLIGHASDTELHAAVDAVADRLERQLVKLKDRFRSKRNAGRGSSDDWGSGPFSGDSKEGGLSAAGGLPGLVR